MYTLLLMLSIPGVHHVDALIQSGSMNSGQDADQSHQDNTIMSGSIKSDQGNQEDSLSTPNQPKNCDQEESLTASSIIKSVDQGNPNTYTGYMKSSDQSNQDDSLPPSDSIKSDQDDQAVAGMHHVTGRGWSDILERCLNKFVTQCSCC